MSRDISGNSKYKLHYNAILYTEEGADNFLSSPNSLASQQIRSRHVSFSRITEKGSRILTKGLTLPATDEDGCFSRAGETTVCAGSSRQMKNRFTVRHGGSVRSGWTDRTDPIGPDGVRHGTAANRRRRQGNQRHGAAAQIPRRLVRFKIVGPLLIQADIIGDVCYLHTLVRSAPRTRSYNEEEHGKPLRAILGVDRRCYRRPTACSPMCPSSSSLPSC